LVATFDTSTSGGGLISANTRLQTAQRRQAEWNVRPSTSTPSSDEVDDDEDEEEDPEESEPATIGLLQMPH
jgi:hypothetical protein